MKLSPVVFIGLDSADPALLLKWEQEGLLPSLGALRRRSLRGRVILPPGLGTGAMWVSLYSGVSPAKHAAPATIQDRRPCDGRWNSGIV